jgi:hypothetical protein
MTMNSSWPSERHAVALVDIIDFKWLMAHEGRHVNVERLQNDSAYARECLALADTSRTPALQNVAVALRRVLLEETA